MKKLILLIIQLFLFVATFIMFIYSMNVAILGLNVYEYVISGFFLFLLLGFMFCGLLYYDQVSN